MRLDFTLARESNFYFFLLKNWVQSFTNKSILQMSFVIDWFLIKKKKKKKPDVNAISRGKRLSFWVTSLTDTKQYFLNAVNKILHHMSIMIIKLRTTFLIWNNFRRRMQFLTCLLQLHDNHSLYFVLFACNSFDAHVFALCWNDN